MTEFSTAARVGTLRNKLARLEAEWRENGNSRNALKDAAAINAVRAELSDLEELLRNAR